MQLLTYRESRVVQEEINTKVNGDSIDFVKFVWIAMWQGKLDHANHPLHVQVETRGTPQAVEGFWRHSKDAQEHFLQALLG